MFLHQCPPSYDISRVGENVWGQMKVSLASEPIGQFLLQIDGVFGCDVTAFEQPQQSWLEPPGSVGLPSKGVGDLYGSSFDELVRQLHQVVPTLQNLFGPCHSTTLGKCGEVNLV